jgi:hypothetical protein
MSEIAQFVHHGAQRITPQILKSMHQRLPLLKLEFAGINAPNFPHLVEQLSFLTNVVEDFAEGAADDVPYVVIAAAVFALIYTHGQVDLIPASNPQFGHGDDSSVARAVLIEHERVLDEYAVKRGINWSKSCLKP